MVVDRGVLRRWLGGDVRPAVGPGYPEVRERRRVAAGGAVAEPGLRRPAVVEVGAVAVAVAAAAAAAAVGVRARGNQIAVVKAAASVATVSPHRVRRPLGQMRRPGLR